MRFDLKNDVQRKIFIYSVPLIIAILAFLCLSRINDILRFTGGIFSHLLPFILGFGLAFLLNGPVIWMENRMHGLNIAARKKRILATAIVFLAFILFLALVLWVVIPSLIDSIKVFIENFSLYLERLEDTLTNISTKFNIDLSQISDFLSSLNLASTLSNYIQSSMSKMMSYSFNFIHGLMNFLISIAAAFYMIMDKEKLLYTFKQLAYAVVGKNRGNFIVLYSMDAKNVFQQYIVGNILDSLIVGVACWLGCLLLRIPYAPMIGLIVGITNVIPVFGPFLGAIPVIILLLLIHPISALVFIIFILVLQQIDGNVLKPVILGDKLGISGFWILFSVSVGGSFFGAAGMFLGVPIFALIYEAVKDLTALRLSSKRLEIPKQSGVIE